MSPAEYSALHSPAAPRKRFLVIEDEEDIAELIQLHLQSDSVEVRTAHHGLEGLELAIAERWHLIILDLRLPGIDGLEICRRLRSDNPYVPVLMLTSRSTELDRVLGLELGADDYLTKPFSIIELQARIKALLRRVDILSTTQPQPETLVYANLHLDKNSRSALLNGKAIHLTAKEFDLLWFFAQAPGKVFTRLELLQQVWGYGHEGYEHTVNSHINRLRGKIEADPARPEFIQTIWGVGYRFGAVASQGSHP